MTFPFCSGKVIDLNSKYTNEVVSQLLNLKAGTYRLNFNYYYPQKSASKKQLRVVLNH